MRTLVPGDTSYPQHPPIHSGGSYRGWGRDECAPLHPFPGYRQCLEIFLDVTVGDTTGIQWVKDLEAAKQLTRNKSEAKHPNGMGKNASSATNVN